MAVARNVEALVHLISQQPAAPLPDGHDLGLDDAGDDITALVTALATHQPPTALGTWELGLLGEDHARKVMDQAGGGELAAKYDHYRAIGQHNGEVHLVLGWTGGERPESGVLVVDPEYGKIEQKHAPTVWLSSLVHDEKQAAAVETLRTAFPALEAPSGDALEAVDADAFAAGRRQPADPAALEAGGHLYFCVADDGTAISVHKKGVRYLDAAGKRKTKNAKQTVASGGLSPEGHAAWFLLGEVVTRVALPAGKPVTELATDGWYRALAVLRDDRLVLRTADEIVLCRAHDDRLEVLDRVVSLELGATGIVQPAFRGGGVVVSAAGQKRSWIFEVVDDRLVARWQLTGRTEDKFGDPTVGVVDLDEDTVLVKTAWPHGRITAVPRCA